jgi:hypothetical protein
MNKDVDVWNGLSGDTKDMAMMQQRNRTPQPVVAMMRMEMVRCCVHIAPPRDRANRKREI